MKNYLNIFVVIASLAFAMTSCGEKTDLDEIVSAMNPDNPSVNPGDIPTSDGVVQTSGMVDLGLSVKWAACDLVSYGDYFATSCKKNGSQFYGITKDVSPLPSEIAGTSLDQATALLGDGWSTPTKAQFEELFNKCRVSYTVYEDVVGLIITGTTKKAIFIPYSAKYWTSSPYYSSELYSANFSYSSYDNSVSIWFGQEDAYYYWDQYYIRPVHE